ncbi:MAG TPA: FHA domain-containing protein [Petrotogaceae bacterium]|nr:FHA domain-containing protein [Petrotogaceae bacterium]HQH32608.1 FHA domain-containing protein [Petrotogaceae bacterium]
MKKVCAICSKVLFPGDFGYEEEFCECGGTYNIIDDGVQEPLLKEDNNTTAAEDNSTTAAVESPEPSENFDRPEEYLKDFGFMPMIEVYKEKNKLFTFNIEYDEITIGRKTSRSFPDIDLSIYDQNKYLSRNHLAVLRLNGKYYARLLSSQNISYLNNSVIKYDEDYELKDGDKIILTKELGIIVRNI